MLLTAAIVTVSALLTGCFDVDGVVVDVDVADPPLGDADGGAGEEVGDAVFEGVDIADALWLGVCVSLAVTDGLAIELVLTDGLGVIDAVGNDEGDAVCVPLVVGLAVIEAVAVPVIVGDAEAPAVTDAVLLAVWLAV